MSHLAPTTVDLDELRQRRLCTGCVGEAFLKSLIETGGKKRKCTYCKQSQRTFTIDEVSSEVERAFEEHYGRTADEPDSYQYAALADKESTYEWSREGEQTIYAIMNAADIPEAAAGDIQAVLEEKYADFDSAAAGEECEFDSDAYYEEKGISDSVWQAEWREFERSLKREGRFFNQAGAEHLATIFHDLDSMQTRKGRRAILVAGPDTSMTSVFRARVFHSPDQLESALTNPDESIGPPPWDKARAGRMNAHGISVFYGANEPEVALAEVRPPVGSWVVVARFEIIKPVRLLDLTALVDVALTGSVFDPTFKRRLERAVFLKSLSHRITRPVMPDDEPFEYLVTQAIADFLANDTKTALDGIIFPSVQAEGKTENVVLFHKAARVERLTYPDGTKLRANSGYTTEDGWGFDFTVYEDLPDEPPKPKTLKGFEHLSLADLPPWSAQPDDPRPVILKVDLKSIKVHEIKSVSFGTDAYPVTRLRSTKSLEDSF
jgi:hypothetical protein